MNLAHKAQGTMNREKRYSSREPGPDRSGVSLLSQMGPLVFVVLAANIFIATLAWSLVGLFLK